MKDHKLIGTTFDPFRQKAKGNQDLLIWLKTHLSHNANYNFSEIHFDNKKFIVLTIYAATNQPVRYNNTAYVRSGSSTTTLSGGSATESELWRKLQRNDFELQGAMKNIVSSELPSLLYIDAYYELNRLTRPSSLEGILVDFVEQEILRKQDDEAYTITNLGALLLAKDLSVFPNLRKRPLRILKFEGNGNFNILDDKTFNEGYAISLQRAEDYIKAVIPSKEIIDGAFRRIIYAYPQRAIRELLSNIVIHQDLTVTTSGPLVNIYEQSSLRERFGLDNEQKNTLAISRLIEECCKEGLIKAEDENAGTKYKRYIPAWA